MVANQFGLKQRIFKRERVRESKNSIVIVPKNNKVDNKNQIEFIWTNNCLKTDHLAILCRVAVKEWKNVLPEVCISRAFFQEKEGQKVRFYISFEVDESISGSQINNIMITSFSILEECLEKVTKKVIGEQEYNLLYPDETKQLDKEAEKNSMKIESDELIKKLHDEIENQEKLLNQLAEQQKTQEKLESSDTIKDIYVKDDKKNTSDITEKLILESSQLDGMVESFIKDTHSTKESKEEGDEESKQLENTLNFRQNTPLKSQKELNKVMLLEKELKELKKENSNYRIKQIDNQSTIDQYETKNLYLKETIKKLEKEKKAILNQAQQENSGLNTTLAEAEKKVILLENKYNNHEENIELLRKQLAQTTIDCDEKTNQLSQVKIQLKDEQKKYQTTIKELEASQLQVNQLEQDLRMAEVMNDVLKERQEDSELEDKQANQIEEWRETYQTLLNKYSELEQESYNYRQEITFLDNQITQIKDEIETKDFNRSSNNQTEILLDQDKNSQEPIEFDYDEDEDYYYFSYESDPYIDEVEAMEITGLLTKEKEKKEEMIRDLLSAYDEGKYGETKIDKSEYRKYVSDLKFLSYRWNQVLNRKDVDTTTDFLGWCDPFIKRIGVFEEGLPVEVKKPFFTKNYVIMNESLYRILKGYSLLSIYLDNYYYRN